MAKGYVIFFVTIKDQAGYDSYMEKAQPAVMQGGGRPIVFHDNAEVLEGQWPGVRTVILEFDSVDAARAWYNSPAYQAAAGERQASADSHVAIVGGFEMPAS